jgi:hypothetical protein
VGRLVERVVKHPRASECQSVAAPALLEVETDEPLERGGDGVAQSLDLEDLPLVEPGGVAQREPGEEIASMERNRLREIAGAIIARAPGTVRVGEGAGELRIEARHVDGNREVRCESDPVAIDAEPSLPECFGERAEGAPERGPGSCRWLLRPEEKGDLRAPAFAPFDEEVGEESFGLAPVELYRPPVQ